MKINNVFLRTYGCTFNIADSQKIIEVLSTLNIHTSSEDKADLIIVNTCGVKSNTEQKILTYLKKLKDKGRDVIITGCLPFISKNTLERIKSIIPNYVAIIHPKQVGYIGNVIKDFESNKSRCNVINDSNELNLEKSQIMIKNQDSPIGILQISEGCLGCCSFCATKNARGKAKSFPLENLKKQLDCFLLLQKKEIWLTAQDCGVVAQHSNNLFDICNYIVEKRENFYVRIGMVNPEQVIKNLDKFLAIFNSNKFFKFLHIPIQSASNKILNLMNRKYNVSDLELIFSTIREKFPGMSIATDVIVGFPQEDQEDFQQTVNFLNKYKPDVVNISKFSSRPGTIARSYKPLDSKEVKDRSEKVTKLVSKITFERNQYWVGWEGPVLLDEKGKNNTIMGRNPSYKCIVLTNGKIGEIKEVKIICAEKTFCLGNVISDKERL